MKRSMVIVFLVVFGSVGLIPGPSGLAQFGPPTAGITVTGTGTANADAETGMFQLFLLNADAFTGAPQIPEAEATPGAAARESAAPIASAVEGVDGVDKVDVAVPTASNPFMGPGAIAVLMVSMTLPTQESVSSMLTTAGQAALNSDLILGYVGALLTTSDCASLELDANAAALEDARGLAADQAELLGVELGEIEGTSSAATWFGQPGAQHGCEPLAPVGLGGPMGQMETFPQFDPALDTVTVEVIRQVTVTFAMAGDAQATPSS